MQLNPTLPQRQALFASLKWEAIFWLLIVAAGFAGVLAAQKIISNPPAADPDKKQDKPSSKPNMYLNAAIALAGSVLISQFFIGIFAQDVRMS